MKLTLKKQKYSQTLRTHVFPSIHLCRYTAYTPRSDTVHQYQLPPLNEGYEENIVLLNDMFYSLDSEGEDSLDSVKDEEHKEEYMANKGLDWMAQGPLVL